MPTNYNFRLVFSLIALFFASVFSSCQNSDNNPVANYNSGMSENENSNRREFEKPNRSLENLNSASEAAKTAWEKFFDKVDITAPAGGDRINILAWNVESDGNNPVVIAQQLQGMKGFNLFALSEVRGAPSSKIYSEAIIKMWGTGKGIMGKTGREDALMFVYNTDVFEFINAEELNDLNPEMKYRSPHALTLKHIKSGEAFIVVNNHLARGNEDNRRIQAAGLREWARKQTLPVIAVGDYNFDYVFETEKGNREFVEFMRDGIWEWVKPEEWVDSNWYDREGDGTDDYAGSMLDFAFVAGPAKDWKATCRILSWEGDFPDDDQTSDHRPVELSLQIK